MYVCAQHVWLVPLKGQKKAWDTLELELQTVLACLGEAETQTQVCKSSKCS